MDWTMLTAIGVDLVGWGLWFPLTHLISRDGPRDNWVSVDYAVSTALLGLSTTCTVLALLLEQPALLTGVAVPVAVVGLTMLAVRSLRSQVRTRAGSYTSDATRAPNPRRQWRTATAPPGVGRAGMGVGDIFSDPLIRDIESRRMPV